MIADSVHRTPEQEVAERQIAQFEQNYGAAALEFACHAAFPLTLTTKLAYCLRQEFCAETDWSVAPVLLLSDLCSEVGEDLYEIAIATRYCLLERLLEEHAEARLHQIALFMAKYISYQLGRDQNTTARFHGQPPEWIALAMLRREEELTELISAQLAKYLQDGVLSRPERLRLASMIRGQADLLSERQFEPITLQQLAARVRRGESLVLPDSLGDLREQLQRLGFPELKTETIEYATISLRDSATQGEELQPFRFEAVTVDAQGREIERSQQEAYRYIETLPKGLNLEMVAIPSGTFLMGSPSLGSGRYTERPQHSVTIQPFFMGRYAITQPQWRIVAALPRVEREIEGSISSFYGDYRPVERVSWLDAVEFCARLSVATGREYRLPSEAEWEYACRAGTTTLFHFGETITEKIASYDSSATYGNTKARQATISVGSFPANQFGLHDMHGNVWEWCEDDWHEGYEGAPKDGSAWLNSEATSKSSERKLKVRRGGSWLNRAEYCRSAYRNYYSPDYRYYSFGLRVTCRYSRTLE